MSQGPHRHEGFNSPWSRWFFAIAVAGVLYVAYHLVQPFLIPIFMAMVLVVVFAPIYQDITRFLGGRRGLGSAVTCLLILLIIALPLFFIISVLTTQALDLYNTISAFMRSGELERSFQAGLGWLAPYLDRLNESLGVEQVDVLRQAGELVRNLSAYLYSNLTGLLAGVTNLVVGLILILFVTFYMLMDGEKLADYLVELSPLPNETNQQIITDLLSSLRATLSGSVVLAVIYGAASGLGFWVFGVPNALFWGTVMVFASVVPIVGTGLVFVPSAIYLAIMGHYLAAVGVFLWCLAVAVICDNILRPKFIGGQARLHPLLTFFAIIGGLSWFGMVGLILGPLVLALLLSLLEVYQRYFITPYRPEPADCAVPAAETSTPNDQADSAGS